ADDSVDLIVFAQAWHWVDSAAASTEAERALRPGGELVLLWNLRDERVPWVRALGEAMRADGDHFRGDPDLPSVGAEFGEPESFTNEWVREVTLPQLLDDVRSRSYFALLSQAEQGAVLDSVTRVAEGATDASGTMELPYVTAAYRYAPAD
ncbi:MAG TPA: methyltransferase domain-containing protein, partial [Terrimesophilobacter sp.]|nr:methyltransferase domain-containing protein [Terrimesophilobacter sp.]